MTFAISSPNFSNGGKIPTKFTCDGTDVSPELTWTAPPPETQSFTMIADDPDAPVGRGPTGFSSICPPRPPPYPKASPRSTKCPAVAARVATTSAKSPMAAPARLPANPHRYFFKLYALDKMLTCSPAPASRTWSRPCKGTYWVRPN